MIDAQMACKEHQMDNVFAEMVTLKLENVNKFQNAQ
jgi:hypothetical protein